ncbi:hypothetical protein MIND_01209400 [Mycena indigotica]|uniref:F-box domain-containing protein n=1 Tax=Mycena indigotica TaxID=2126181 RepID=A0A8H6S6H6_9AGAR|nr:uncharacterized protein MIND_01209400 [Mycena indigotica]KAF7293100.1 hypothetical protein MIND_01209400 [Mycena indigotica]
MASESLPPELLEIVIGFIDDCKTLKASAVVCHTFCVPAQKRLFTSFTLLPSSLPGTSVAPPQGLDAFLAKATHIASYVRCLTVVCPHSNNWVGAILPHFVLFTRLTSLVVDCREYSLRDASITWQYFHTETLEALRALAALPSMHTLELYSADLSIALQLLPPQQPPPVLRHLALYNAQFNADIPLALDSPDAEQQNLTRFNLESLELHPNPLRELSDPIFARFVNLARLRHVHLTFPLSIYEAYAAQVQVLQHAVELEHLQLTYLGFDTSTDPRVLDIGHLSKLHTIELTIDIDANVVSPTLYSVVEMVICCIDIPSPVQHVIIGLALAEPPNFPELTRSLTHFVGRLVPLCRSWVDRSFTPTLLFRIYMNESEQHLRNAVWDEVKELGMDVSIEVLSGQ